MSPAHERGEIIVEYLTREKVPYVFGLCSHGNVGLLDAQVNLLFYHGVFAPRARCARSFHPLRPLGLGPPCR